MEVVVFVGLQASGKTTLYRARFAATHDLVSKDLLHNNRRPQRRQMQLIEEALRGGRSVVVDSSKDKISSASMDVRKVWSRRAIASAEIR